VGCPHPSRLPAPDPPADKLGLATNSTVPGPRLTTIAASDQLRADLVHPRRQTVQNCRGSFLTPARAAFSHAAAPFSRSIPDVVGPNLVKAIGACPVPPLCSGCVMVSPAAPQRGIQLGSVLGVSCSIHVAARSDVRCAIRTMGTGNKLVHGYRSW